MFTDLMRTGCAPEARTRAPRPCTVPARAPPPARATPVRAGARNARCAAPPVRAPPARTRTCAPCAPRPRTARARAPPQRPHACAGQCAPGGCARAPRPCAPGPCAHARAHSATRIYLPTPRPHKQLDVVLGGGGARGAWVCDWGGAGLGGGGNQKAMGPQCTVPPTIARCTAATPTTTHYFKRAVMPNLASYSPVHQYMGVSSCQFEQSY